MPRPRLALTLGDPAGIGPEIILKALADPDLHAAADITVIGDSQPLLITYNELKEHVSVPLAHPSSLLIQDCQTATSITPGTGDQQSGQASFIYLQTAVRQTLAGSFDGVVTAPIAKFAWTLAGHSYPGQTEVLAKMSGSESYGMLFVARSPHTHWLFKVLLATTHIPLKQVPQVLSTALVQAKLDLLVQTLQQDFQIRDPIIAVAGLNPHSGEAGQLGDEEVTWLTPLLQQYSQAKVIGPVPPDTLWVKPAQAWHQEDYQGADAYLALYHDQGLIPIKLLAFDQAVNTTIGLPFVRTSPDHGTAFDIVGQGQARADSLKAAIWLAIHLSTLRLTLRLKG